MASSHLLVRHRSRSSNLFNHRDQIRQYNLAGPVRALVRALVVQSHTQELKQASHNLGHPKTPPPRLSCNKRKQRRTASNVPSQILQVSAMPSNYPRKAFLRNIPNTVRLQQIQAILPDVLYNHILKTFDLWHPHHLIQPQQLRMFRRSWPRHSQPLASSNLFLERTPLRNRTGRHMAPPNRPSLSI